MSKKTQWKLTDHGVLALYGKPFKSIVRLQVIFKTQIDSTCYMRLSDGQHLSPVMLIRDYHDCCYFSVGAVIDIKETLFVPFEDYSEDGKLDIGLTLTDDGLHRVYVETYRVVGNRVDVDCVLGSLRQNDTYRNGVKHVLTAVAAWCREYEQMNWEYFTSENESGKVQADQLREQGNAYFKQCNYAEAISFYDVAKVKDPYDCRVWSNCSHAHYKMEEYLEAELHALVAMKVNPFYDKAYYRAAQAAIKDCRRSMAEHYVMTGIFVCGENRELRQTLEEAARLPKDPEEILEAIITDRIRGFNERLLESFEFNRPSSHRRRGNAFKETQGQLMKKRYVELSGAFGREVRKEINKKLIKKSKNPSHEKAAASPTKAEKKGKEEEERKHVQEFKKEDKHSKSKPDLNEALEEGQRLFHAEQFHQAIEMYSKCLTYKGLTDNSNNFKVKPHERYEVQVIHFIIGMCKVQSSRGYILEGLEAMQALCQDPTKFPHQPATRYWLAVSFEKICCFKLAQKHAQCCKDALKKPTSFKPVKWPGTDQNINCTTAEVLEDECKLLLDKLSSARPSPKAKCRYKKCITTQGILYAKEEIYLRDPDFKGYLNVVCEEDCVVSYHPCCWKAVKEQHDGSVNRMSDKDFLGQVCVTPDCTGKITSVQIIDDAGELKNVVVKDKKEKKNMAATGKQKKKKDKKKEKNQTHKRRNRVESVCEDQATSEETSPVTAEKPLVQTTTITAATATTTNHNNNDKHKSHPMPVLPIDAESLEMGQVTILKPGAETDILSPTKATKKNKKKKVKKPVNQPNLLGDPLEADLCAQSEYIARLRVLRQQRDALEAGENPNAMQPVITPGSGTQNPVIMLDPDNPFYLPQHLRDNPEELERVLQKKLTTSSPPGLQQETISTLLDFMYDWLKSEGPMHTNDARLAEQVAESFPQEAREYVSQCGGITGLLMQSIKFAMIDSIICVCDDVMAAQEMVCRQVNEKMTHSKYLVRYSDGQKAKRFTHLLDDAKSTCSTASSSSQLAGSVAESAASYRSSSRWRNNSTCTDDHNNNNNDNDNDNESCTSSLAPLSKSIVDKFNMFAVCALNPTAPEFEPLVSNSEEKDDEDDYEDEEEEEEGEGEDDSQYIEKWAAKAGEEVPLRPDEEEEEEMSQLDEGDVPESLQDEEDLERAELQQYISQLEGEKDDLARDLDNEQQQNQVLSDKLFQVKSQYKSEVMKLKEQLEELKDRNKELSAEKNATVTQKDADLKKYKMDFSRVTEEMKTNLSRLQSLELKGERFLDHNNELKGKLAEEMEINTQLKEELEKMKNLQESLTSCSRRAREAEIKYLTTKRDLVDDSITRTIVRLIEEGSVMKELLPGVTEDSPLDRTTLTHTAAAWDKATKDLIDQQRVFKEESTRLLGMIHQGRPLSALPAGDLAIPAIPSLTISPLLYFFRNTNKHHKPPPPILAVPEALPKNRPRHPSPAPQLPHHIKTTPPPPRPESAPPMPIMPIMPVPLMPLPPGPHTSHPIFMHNGGPPPNHPSAYASGAIPKNAVVPPPSVQPGMTSEVPSLAQQSESPNQLFVGQLPWEFTEADVKKLLPTSNTVGAINALPPKLVRPQNKTFPNAFKLGGQTIGAKDDNMVPSSSSYVRLIKICKQHFGKEFSAPDICAALGEVRIQNNNTLSGWNTEKIVERVRQQLRSRRPSTGVATRAPWASLTQGQGVKAAPEWQGPSKKQTVKEETCSICLEPLNTSPNQSLACQHVFHARCINDWIKIQSNCPNCRKFALMEDEYPTLS